MIAMSDIFYLLPVRRLPAPASNGQAAVCAFTNVMLCVLWCEAKDQRALPTGWHRLLDVCGRICPRIHMHAFLHATSACSHLGSPHDAPHRTSNECCTIGQSLWLCMYIHVE